MTRLPADGSDSIPRDTYRRRSADWKTILPAMVPTMAPRALRRNAVLALSYLLLLWVVGARLLLYL